MYNPKYKFPGGILKADGTPIPENEPVFLLRAQDKFALVALKTYLGEYYKVLRTPAQEDMWLQAVLEHIKAFENWPTKKLPD